MGWMSEHYGDGVTYGWEWSLPDHAGLRRWGTSTSCSGVRGSFCDDTGFGIAMSKIGKIDLISQGFL